MPLLVLLAIVVANVIWLWPEASPPPDLNDNVLHLTLINGMENEVRHGRNPFDFWSPEIALGQPIARMYQPLGHALVVLAYYALFKMIPLPKLFVWFRFAALAGMPASFFWCANLLGLPPAAQIAAAAMAPLVSGDGFGIDHGAYVWGGRGLFPQLVATHFLLLSIGFGWQAIRYDGCWWLPAILVAITGWSNLLYGYVAAMTLVMTLIPPGARWPMALQLCKIGALSALCAAPKAWVWMKSPGAVSGKESGNRSFMSDSFGAGKVLHDAVTGKIMDLGRVPSLTVLAALGIVATVAIPSDPGTFILAALIGWVLLYFGRPFWGRALYLFGILPAMQLHRLIGPVQIFGVLVASTIFGIAWGLFHPFIGAPLLLLAVCGGERSAYLRMNAGWMAETHAAFAADGADIEQALALAKARGGRAYAGLPATWGKEFRIGHVPVYSLFPVRQIPCVGYLYIGFTSQAIEMYSFNDTRLDDYWGMDVRTVITPAGSAAPLAGAKLLSCYGRFAVYDGIRQG